MLTDRKRTTGTHNKSTEFPTMNINTTAVGKTSCLNPFRTAVPFWRQTTQSRTSIINNSSLRGSLFPVIIPLIFREYDCRYTLYYQHTFITGDHIKYLVGPMYMVYTITYLFIYPCIFTNNTRPYLLWSPVILLTTINSILYCCVREEWKTNKKYNYWNRNRTEHP